MRSLRSLVRPCLAAAPALGLLTAMASAQAPVDARVMAALTWRNIGPFRGGRVSAVTGAMGQPGVYYAGFPGGGVWKTTSAGEVWYPVFDGVRDVSSVGAVEVAPSNADVVYVGTGDMITGGTLDQGKGVYRSDDAGKSWRHLGLDSTRHIQNIMVDTRDPNVVLVGALGDPLRKSDARGVFRSADGGRTWAQTLYVDDETGIAKLARAYDVPNVVYATTVWHYAEPSYAQRSLRSWQFGIERRADSTRTGTAIYRSTDGGGTWQAVITRGLPRLEGRTSLAVAMGTNAQRLYLVTNRGLHRSDDGGATWTTMAADDERIRNGQGGYSCGVYVDPKNPDVVYTLNTAVYKSIDGGRTFTGFKGAPGGDDPQQLWIDPAQGQRMLLGLDQGAVVTLDGGATWSSWYNQSTEQLYHIATDNSTPYWVYATQQDAGAIRARSRGNAGAVTIFDWNAVNGWEWGTILPDPKNPNVVYASGNGLVKITYPSEQWINVSPAIDPGTKVRTTSDQPLVWAPWDARLLLAGFNFVAATIDGGATWRRLSPELGIPKGLDSAAASTTTGGRGAIEALAASPVGRGVIWAGTSNGLIHLSRNGGATWTDVSIVGLPNARRANVSSIAASPHLAGTAYAAIEYLRIGDHAPYLYRTRDFGVTWTRISAGLPTDDAGGSFARVVVADPKRRGLLFAGTESGVYLSFDEGDRWQPLQLNLPPVPVRDLVIKDNDLIAGTHGRGIWILDDISMLRQATPSTASERVHLFTPGDALRIRRNVNWNTPLPPEMPHGLNPLPGAILDYWLAEPARGELTLDVLDATGVVVRHLSSVAAPPVAEAARAPHPDFWLAAPLVLPTSAGHHRVNWDLRRDAPPSFAHSFEISANPGLTPTSPEGALVPPGSYTLRLSASGVTTTTSVTVRQDPRSPATAADVRSQYAYVMRLDAAARSAYQGAERVAALRLGLVATGAATPPVLDTELKQLAKALDALDGAGSIGRPVRALRALSGTFVGLLTAQENADQSPTPAMRAASVAACTELRAAISELHRIQRTLVARLNFMLAELGRPLLSAGELESPGC